MKTIFPLIVLICLLGNSSCSLLTKKVQKDIEIENYDELQSATPPYKLSYACNCENRDDEGFLPLDNSVLRSNIYSQTIIKIERQGYIPKYLDVPKRFSPYAAADILTGGVILATTIYLTTKTFNQPFIEDAFDKKFMTVGTGGILSYMYIGNGILASKINAKKINVTPEMTPFPQRSDSTKFVEIKNLNLSLGEYSMIEYKNIKRLKKGHESKRFTKKINESDFQANFVLNKFLTKSGFIDTVNAVKSSNNTVILDANISDFSIHKIFDEELASFEFTIKWSFKDVLSKKVLLKETTHYKSHLLVYKNEFNHDYFENIIINSFNDLINRDSVSKILKYENDIDSSNDQNDVLNINNSEGPNNLTEAMKSSVIIKSEDSFKSGVIISQDGYILTELGSLNNDNKQIEVIFPNNNSVEGSLVRLSRRYNIALIKVDKNNLTSLKVLNKSEMDNLKTGKKVFSIGVTGDIRLGQSLNNGVISGVRNIDGEKYIQTDLKMSNSSVGSPILDENHQLVGIMTTNSLNQQVEGINFAIPIDVIQESLNIYFKD